MRVERKQLWLGALWCALLLLVLASYWMMRASQNRLRAAQTQLQDCEALAKDISSLQNRPGFAALGVDSPRTITARAEEAGEQAEILAESLVRIEPQSAVRLRDSAYRIRPTRLELRRVSLQQVLSFTHAMIDESQGTTIRDIRLTATDPSATESDDADSWTAELVLTQLIFSPLKR